MAEALGAAVLTVSVDDTQLRAGLLAVQSEAQRTASIVQQAFAQAAQAQRQPAAARPPLPPPIPPELLRGVDDYRRATQGATDAARIQEGVLRRTGAAARGVGADFDLLAGALGQLGIAASAAGVAAAIGNEIKSLDSANAALRTLGADSEGISASIRALSQELGNNVSQVDLTKAAYDVVSSGFGTAAEATDILRASAYGAIGGFSRMEDVARGLAGVINAYGLTAKDATRIVDLFAQTQNDGVITIRQYVDQIGNVSSVAAAAGISLEEVNAAIATATLKGVQPDQAFTGLTQALNSILKPSQEAITLSRQLGVDFSLAAVQAKGFTGVLADLFQKGAGSPDKLAKILGSTEAQRSLQPIINNLDNYNKLLENQRNAVGPARRAFEEVSGTIEAGFNRATVAFKNFAAELEPTIGPGIKQLIGDLEQVITLLEGARKALPGPANGALRGVSTGLVLGAPAGFAAGGLQSLLKKVGLNPDKPLFSTKETISGLNQVSSFFSKSFLFGAGAAVGGLTDNLIQSLSDGAKKAEAQAGGGKPKPIKPKVEPAPQPKLDTTQRDADLELIRTENALQLQGIEARRAALRDVGRLEGVQLQQAEGRRAVEEKIRAAKLIQANLDRELAKPEGDGITNLEGSQSATRIEKLRGDLANANAETRLAYEQAGKDLVKAAREAAAITAERLRKDREFIDRIQGIQRERAIARSGLNSPIDVVDPGSAAQEGRRRVAASVASQLEPVIQARQEFARLSQAALMAERKALQEKTEAARSAATDAAQAAAEAGEKLGLAGDRFGQALRDGATEAARQLRDAQAALNDVIRSKPGVFSQALVNEQLQLARAEIQPLVDRGVIRSGLPLQTPEQIFGLASDAQRFINAENQRNLALAQRDAANAAAANAIGLYDNSINMASLGASLDRLAGKDWTVNVSVQPPTAALPGV